MSSCGCSNCGESPEQPVSELGDRLAAWLEELGLADHLAAAGLPTYHRDANARARWSDPATGKPMTPEQIEALDRQLHSDGSDPAYAVPVALLQIARRARVRQQLLDSDWFTYESLATLRGETVNSTRFSVHKGAAEHGVLLVAKDELTLIPAFQFNATGARRAEIEALLTPLLAAGMDPWNAWAWLTQPAALLGGLVPHEAAEDPEEAAIAVHAAVRLAERVAAEK